MSPFLRTINESDSKKIQTGLKSSKDFSFVVWGLHGEFYVLRGKLEKFGGKAVFDSDKNIGKIIAQIGRTQIDSADFSFSNSDHASNTKARVTFIKFLDKVLGTNVVKE